MWLKALFNALLALPQIIAWFKELQGVIRGSPIGAITENREIVRLLKEMPKGDKKLQKELSERIAAIILDEYQ